MLIAVVLLWSVCGCAEKKTDEEYTKFGNYKSYTKIAELCIHGGVYSYIEVDGKHYVVPLFNIGAYGLASKIACKD